MSLDASVWGPHYWFFLHTLALKYPLRPNAATKKRYYELITNFYMFIPVDSMGTAFLKLLDEYPLTPYLDSRESLVRWVHFIHNKVNARLEKPKISLSAFYETYYEKYKPSQERSNEFRALINKILYLIIVIFFVSAIIYFYEK